MRRNRNTVQTPPSSGDHIARGAEAAQHSASAAPLNGVLVLDGFGIRVTIDGRSLHVADGIGEHRRATTFHPLEVRRGPHRLCHLVIRGRSANLDLAVIPWCHSQAITVSHVSHSGHLLWTSPPPGRDDARLRRAQALAGAPEAELGLRIATELVAAKVSAEDRCLEVLGLSREQGGRAEDPVLTIVPAVGLARGLRALRTQEAFSASTFWAALESVTVPWISLNRDHIPAHWQTCGPRSSPLGGYGPRRAVTPFHAALNVLFASVELEATVACHTVALDPGMGFLHLDAPRRRSLACDLMEPVRPQAVLRLFGLLQRRPLSVRDVVERPDGEVRCRPAFFQELWSLAPIWRRAVGPIAEQVAAQITGEVPARLNRRPLQAPTPLTGLRRRKAVADRHGWVQIEAGPRQPGPALHTCLGCGGPVAPTRLRCPSCARTRREELTASARQSPPTSASPRIAPSLSQLAAYLELSEEATSQRLHQAGRRRLAAMTGSSVITAGRWTSGVNLPQQRWWASLKKGLLHG
ncbi:MAG: CRISPR-associated endonuclease Cas1 [Candidatus Dormiibacterota bacterium]